VHIIQISKEDLDPYSKYIASSDVAISMLPAAMHLSIAKLCLRYKTHLITPSYISPEMASMDAEAKAKDLIFLNEMGFDPGIDHMTTMAIYHKIISDGGELKGYKSYAGGLVAAKCDNNPWNYKFSWNPRNVILAGQGGEIVYKKDRILHRIQYEQLFENSEIIDIHGNYSFDAYANRDSLQYESHYHWENLDTILRGTLRKRGFCRAWNFIIQLGLTENTKVIELHQDASYYDFYALFYQIPYSDHVEDAFYNKYPSIQKNDFEEKLKSIGFFDRTSKLKIVKGTAAQLFQSILEEKWKLDPQDTDWVVMVHFFEYTKGGKTYEIESSMTLEGEDEHYTAMSKTVGMPIAFACEMIIKNQMNQRGVFMPIYEEIYRPILKRLEDIDIRFHENVKELN
jgi:saccharopine dehydrogenase-like NADP-dependent oxidoreductase